MRLLDLSRKALGFVSSIFIGTLLRGNSYITELILHSNELTPNGATIVVRQLLGSLKTLDIANIVHVEERAKGEKKTDKKNPDGSFVEEGKARACGCMRYPSCWVSEYSCKLPN